MDKPRNLDRAMNCIVALSLGLMLLMLTGCASVPSREPVANKDGSLTVTIPPDRTQECLEQGGCRLMSLAELQRLVQAAMAAGAKAGI